MSWKWRKESPSLRTHPFPPRDPAALARALESYLTQPAAARAAGAHNRSIVSTEFSWRASALRLLDVYSRVIDARQGDRRASA